MNDISKVQERIDYAREQLNFYTSGRSGLRGKDKRSKVMFWRNDLRLGYNMLFDSELKNSRELMRKAGMNV